MKKILKSEELILKAYLELPVRKLLNHKFELEESYLAGDINSFLKGKRFEEDHISYTQNEMDMINSIIVKNINNNDGKDLLNAFLITQASCNILNKYRVIE